MRQEAAEFRTAFLDCRHDRTGMPGLEMIPMLGLYEWLHEEIESENRERQESAR
jgi:hypothetical protein